MRLVTCDLYRHGASAGLIHVQMDECVLPELAVEVGEPKPCEDRRDARECDWCGEPSGDGKFCSRGCREASESDHA